MLESILQIIQKVFAPITEAVEETPDGIWYFLKDASVIVAFDDIPLEIEEVIQRLEDSVEAIQTLTTLLEEENAAVEEVMDALSILGAMPAQLDALNSISFGEISVSEIGRRIINYLFLTYLKREQLDFFQMFWFIGCITKTEDALGYERFDIKPLFTLLSDPPKWFRETFAWGTSEYDSNKLIQRLKLLLEQVLLFPHYSTVRLPDTPPLLQLFAPLFYMEADGELLEAGLKIGPAMQAEENVVEGILIELYGLAQSSGQLTNEAETFEIKYQLSAEAEVGKMAILPDGLQLAGDLANTSMTGKLYLGNKSKPEPLLLLGAQGSSRLEAKAIGAQLGLSLEARQDCSIELILNGARIVISPGDGDGFIQKLLPFDELALAFELGLGWSYLDGFYFSGSAGFEVNIPLHKTIGPVLFKYLQVKLDLQSSAPSILTLKTAFVATVGPLKFALGGLGLGLGLEVKRGGQLGFLELDGPKFILPNQVGIELMSSAIAGGGLLEIDAENHRYVGMLHLKFSEIELVAIGLVNTRLPGGKPGYSVLISIGVVFSPAIQLAFGFVLKGVGGLVGIHRTMIVDEIQAGLRTGVVDSLMFPDDPIGDADKILSDLRTVFPPKENHYVIAPFVKGGWTEVIEFDIGLFIELPWTGRMVLLGSISAILPESEDAIIKLNVDIFGDLNFAKKRILLLGTLRDSTLLNYPLRGDFGFVLAWGEPKQFLMSVGGFHPRFPQPQNFPSLKRIQLDISYSKNLQIYAEHYQAITTNSFQFGLAAELRAKYSGVQLDANLSFDAFFKFSPFEFAIDLSLSARIKFKGKKLAGVALALSLSGPAPYHARGKANFSLLLWDVSVKFNKTWGRSRPASLPEVDPWPQLAASLSKSSNWSTVLPASSSALESLRSLEAESNADKLILHPLGTLEIRQQVLPFNLQIEKLGNARLVQSRSFEIDRFLILAAGQEVEEINVEALSHEAVYGQFARGQYLYLSDADKLSLPAFEPLEAGVQLRARELRFFGVQEAKALEYENVLIQANLTKSTEQVPSSGKAIRTVIQQNKYSAANRLWNKRPAGRYSPIHPVPDLEQADTFLIVQKATLQAPRFFEDKTFGSHSKAAEALNSYLRTRTDMKDKLQIMSSEALALA